MKRNTMNKKTIWELITRQLPPDKEKEVWSKIQASQDLLCEYKELKRIWSLSAAQQPFSDSQIDSKYKQFKKHYQKQSIGLHWFKQVVKYAAVIAISIIVSYSYLITRRTDLVSTNQVQHIEAGSGTINKVVLADGSQIWLNSNSSVNIIDANDEKIELELNGEALFDIIHDDNRQFVVNVKNLIIEDLGTRFTVRNYPNDELILATLLDGEIAVKDTQQALNQTLVPGQQLSYSLIDGTVTINTVDTTYVGQWTEEKFEFVNKTLEDIAKDIENWYGVTIRFQKDKLKHERFTGVIQKSTSVENVLDIIAYSAGIKYSINTSKNKTEIMIH